MILTLDVGNTQVHAGVFKQDKLLLQFRKSSLQGVSSDEMGLFFRMALKENNLNPDEVHHVALCSVVPNLIYSIANGVKKYFGLQPFILQAGVKTGLKIKYRNPLEVGSDRIANAIAALKLYRDTNLLVIDMGTATTFCAIRSNQEYLGGSIVPGLRLCMESLEAKTAKLPTVEIVKPNQALGRSTVESIQSGLYYGHLGTMKQLIESITHECFADEKPYVIGTGGFAYLFEGEGVFDVIEPTLVLQGLCYAMQMNM